VIFITGHEDPAAEAMVMQAGASGFLIKPFKDEQLLSLVRPALRHSPTTSGREP
jgi:FixJ family two-component response regulator